MDDQKRPGPLPPAVVRSCQISRLQGQLLVHAYQQVYPQIGRVPGIPGVPRMQARASSVECDSGSLKAATRAAGA